MSTSHRIHFDVKLVVQPGLENSTSHSKVERDKDSDRDQTDQGLFRTVMNKQEHSKM